MTYAGTDATDALHVLDRDFVTNEVLTGHTTFESNSSQDCSRIHQPPPCTLQFTPGPSISDDGRVIVTSAAPPSFPGTPSGEYEYRAAPAP